MPTDPFVNPDLDDRPRHRQNLPAGVAVPPSPPWHADRPGDAGRFGQGALRGSPGPNVGFGYTLAERARDRLVLSVGEHADDAVVVIAEVAMKRAAGLGRAPVVADVDVAVALLGYESAADAGFASVRATAAHGAAHDYRARRRIVDAVPESLLCQPTALAMAASAEWRATFAA